MNQKDIITRLRNGETIEDIAAELTEELNSAKEAYEAETAGKAVLQSAAELLVASLLDYLNIIDPEAIEDIGEEEEKELARFLVDEASLMKNMISLTVKPGKTTFKAKSKSKDNLDSIFEDFFKKYLS